MVAAAPSVRVAWSDTQGLWVPALAPLLQLDGPATGIVSSVRANPSGGIADYFPAQLLLEWAPVLGAKRTALADLGESVAVSGSAVKGYLQTVPILDQVGGLPVAQSWATLLGGAVKDLLVQAGFDAFPGISPRPWVCSTYIAAPPAVATQYLAIPPYARRFRLRISPDQTSTWRTAAPWLVDTGGDSTRGGWLASWPELVESIAGKWIELPHPKPATSLRIPVAPLRAAGITLADVLRVQWECEL